jgi:hypothetical protein
MGLPEGEGGGGQCGCGGIPGTAGAWNGHGTPVRLEGHSSGWRDRMRLLCACAAQFHALLCQYNYCLPPWCLPAPAEFCSSWAIHLCSV